LSDANAYCSIAQQLLRERCEGLQDIRIPVKLTRDALCRGFGYSSYSEVEYLLTRSDRSYGPDLTDEDLLEAFARGFGMAVVGARKYGFNCAIELDDFARQLALEELRIIRTRRDEQPAFCRAAFSGEGLPAVGNDNGFSLYG
jgi:hypothetical protein